MFSPFMVIWHRKSGGGGGFLPNFWYVGGVLCFFVVGWSMVIGVDSLCGVH